MGQKKVEYFSAPGSKTSSIPLKNPERVRGSEGRRHRRTARSKGQWWGQREKIYNGKMGDKRFGDEGGAKEQH